MNLAIFIIINKYVNIFQKILRTNTKNYSLKQTLLKIKKYTGLEI